MLLLNARGIPSFGSFFLILTPDLPSFEKQFSRVC